MKRHALLITVGIIGLLTVSAGVTVATDTLPEDQDIDFDPPEEPDNTSLYEPNAGVDKLSSDSRNVTAVIEASEVSPDRLDELENLGASVQSRYEQHIQVTIEAGASHTYSSLPWVEGIRRPYRGSSDVVSEGVGVINADDLHANGITGQNVKVGVIDGGGFDLSSSEISSNIAGHKSFKSSGGIGDGSEHGTATAEVVVDVAPDSELYVANFNTGTEYANAVNWMRNQNVDVIVMSASFFGQPYDGGGFISDVADDAVRQDGIVWANSAGNYAKAHWQGSFSNPDGDQWLDFAAGDDEANYLNGGNPLNANDPVWITLNWDDWDQSDQDYDLHLIKASDDSVVASSESSQTGFQRPTESIRTTVPADGKYYAAIEVEDAAAPQKLEMFFIREGETPEHNVAKSSVTAPAAGDSVTSVGAFFYRDGSLEDFSSHGPTNDGRTGVDVVAPDGVSNDAFGSYFGTSAAAPHVGGAAALMLADDASLSPQNVEQKLESTATDIRSPGEDTESGYGKVDVLAAVQQGQPTASFTFSPSSPDTSDTVSFDASGSSDSDGTIQTYEWDFDGDGTTEATGQTASHSYSNSGTYTVELTVTDDDGATDTTSQTVSVAEPNSAPTASFTFSPSSPGTSDTISFDGSGSSDSDGSIQSYSWDLDDGTTSTGQTTSHSYSSSGTYTVELTVTDDEGATDTTTQTISVAEPNSAPTASFTFSPNNPDTSDTISFDGSGSSDPDGSVTSYEWDFGDGTTATGQSTSHSYSTSGTYTVTLTVTDNEGATDTTSQTVSVAQPNSPPTASFTFSPNSPDTSDAVSFDASGSSDTDGSIQTYDWDFGDGNTATGETTTHSYSSSGTYTVSLTITDDEGATDTTTQTISVNSPPTASFTFAPSSPSTSDTVTFDASGSSDPDGTIQSYDWDLGDGTTATGETASHSYGSSGTYTVTLTVTDDNGATDTTTQTVTVGNPPNQPPTASFTLSPNNPDTADTVTFDASGSSDPDGTIQTYEWDFDGDGTTDQTAPNPTVTHSYSSSGTYTATLTVTDNDGATDTTSKTVSVAQPNSPPTASFTFSPNNPDTSDTVTFDGSGSSDSDGSIQSYEWDLDDGTTATGETPSHSYSTSGTYTITLTVTDNEGATDTASQTISVAEPNSAPTASFTFAPSSPSTSDTVSFDASGSSDPDGTIQTYEWDFDGDGTTDATGQTASHSYSSSGTYTAELTVTDDDGATDTTTQTISVGGVSEGDATVESSNVPITGVGETGESTVTIDAEKGVSVANIEISVDASVAEIKNVDKGADIDTSDSGVTFNVMDQTADSVRVEYNNIGADANPVSDFEVAVVEFEARTNNGETTVDITPDGVFDGNTDEYVVGTEEGTLTAGAEPANYELSNLTPEESTVTDEDDPIDISVDTKNVGEVQGEQDLELTVENASGIVFSDSTSVRLGAGENTTATFKDVPAGSLEPGEYDHVVSSGNDTVEGNLTVESTALFKKPLPGFNNPPQNTEELDPTLYEDVNGNGDGLPPSEAVLLWSELVQNPEGFNDLTQEQIDALDWNGDGQLTPADAVILWSEKVQA